MAVSTKVLGQAIASMLNKEVDWDSDTIKVALFTNAHAPDQDVDQYYDAAHGMTEVSNGNGYTTGGATLANKTATYTAGTNTYAYDADDVNWTTSTITARYAVVYDDTPGSNKPMLCYVDFGQDEVSSAGTLTIAWNASGVFKFVVD